VRVPPKKSKPHLLKQLGAGEEQAGVLGQLFQQLELFVGQVKWTSAQPHRDGVLVDHQVTESDRGAALLLGQRASPTQ
jgi:hypothetical protein